jgi:hypothetical protein
MNYRIKLQGYKYENKLHLEAIEKKLWMQVSIKCPCQKSRGNFLLFCSRVREQSFIRLCIVLNYKWNASKTKIDLCFLYEKYLVFSKGNRKSQSRWVYRKWKRIPNISWRRNINITVTVVDVVHVPVFYFNMTLRGLDYVVKWKNHI